MTYQETIEYLFSATPVFQRDGGSAYKPGLETIQALDRHFGHPHQSYSTIHVGGTNGKGSTSHTLAAILQAAGYRVGLFTSPHLVDFRERIRVNGEMIDESSVVDFVERARTRVAELQPSFFELTTMMALEYFRAQGVDIAVIEVGLGGRLDSTNIISPLASIITNISLDHMQYLGEHVAQIAREKAGIIKPHIPTIVGNAEGEGVRSVLESEGARLGASMYWAEESNLLQQATLTDVGYLYQTRRWGLVRGELSGLAQVENTRTILCALEALEPQLKLTPQAVARGFASVTSLTGLRGRWQTLGKHPRLICDTGHNPAGIQHIVEQLRRSRYCYQETHIVLGMAGDKDVRAVLALLPRWARYYWTAAQAGRALPETELQALAAEVGLEGESYPSVGLALEAARAAANSADLIFVGGSNFVVADLLTHLQI